MFDYELPYVLIGVVIVVFAAISAWIEVRVERRAVPPHRKVLYSESRYREHIARRR